MFHAKCDVEDMSTLLVLGSHFHITKKMISLQGFTDANYLDVNGVFVYFAKGKAGS